MADSLIHSIGTKIDYFKKNPHARRMSLLKKYKINLILDVGANTGQYARELRKIGYSKRIISFEPLKASYDRLARNAARDPHWSAFHVGLGKHNEEKILHVSGDTRSSSFQPMLETHQKVASYFRYVRDERTTVRKLDSLLPEITKTSERIFLKIDAQGFEKPILQGAKRSLKSIQGIQIEMSLSRLYQGDVLMVEMVKTIERLGFSLMSLEYGFCDPKTGRMLQVDGIFFRDK